MPEETVSILAVLKDRFTGPTKKISKETTNWSNSLVKVNRGIDKLIGKAVRLTTVFGGLSAAGTAALGLKLAADLEKTALSFEVLLGSAEAATKVLKDLDEFAATTPFQLPALQEAARTLVSYGLELDKLIPTLRSLGDVAAGTDSDIRDLARIFGRVQSIGRATNESLVQFAERGIPIYSELADILGVSVEEIRNLASGGQIGITQLQQAFQNLTSEGGKFFDLTRRQSQTVSGLFSTLVDNIQKGLREFFLAFSGDTAGLLDGLIRAVQNFNENVLPRLVITTRELINTVVKPGIVVVRTLAPIVLGAVAAVAALKVAWTAVNVALTIANGLAGTFALLTAPISLSLTAIVAAATLLSLVLLDIGARLAGQDGILGTLSEIGELIKDLEQGTITIADVFDALFTQIKVLGTGFKGFFVGPIVNGIKLVGETIGNSLIVGFKAVQLTIVSAADVGIQAILGLVRGAAGLIDDFTASVDAVFEDSLLEDIVGEIDLASNIKSKIPATVAAVSELRQRIEAEYQEAVNIGGQDFTRGVDEIVQGIEDTQDEIDQLWDDYDQRAQDRADQRRETANDITDFENQLNRERIRREEELQARLLRIRSDTNREAREAVLEQELSDLEDNLQDRLISYEDYIERRKQLETSAINERIDFLQTQLDAEQAIYDAQLEAGESIEGSLNRIIALELELQGLNFDKERILRNLVDLRKDLAQAAQDEREAETRIRDDLQLRELQAQGFDRGAESIRFFIEQQRELEEAAGTLSDELMEQLLAVQELERAAFDLNQTRQRGEDQLKDLKDAEDEYRNSLEQTENLATTGSISFVEAFTRNSEALEQYKDKAAEVLEELKFLVSLQPELQAEFGSTIERLEVFINGTELATDQFQAFTNGVVEGVKAASSRLDEFNELGQEIGRTLTQQFGTGIVGALESVVDGTKSAGEAFRQFAADTLRQIARLIIQFVILRTVSGIFGGFPGFQSGGLIEGFATGGFIDGPPSTGDNRVIRAQSGEYVQRKSAVNYYGVGVMNALNRRLVPKSVLAGFGASGAISGGGFQSGGVVTGAEGRSGGPVAAVMVADEQSAEALLNGGRNAFFEFFEQNSTRLKGILGES